MKGQERRESILKAAMALFAEKGFRGTTTRQLAAAAGVTEPVLYRHFQTKHDLYCAIIETKAEQSAAVFSGLRDVAARCDDEAFLTALGELILRRYEDDPEMSRILLFSSLERHELSSLFFERVFRNFYTFVAEYIRVRIDARAFLDVVPEAAARSLIGMFAYHGLMRLLFPDKLPPADRKKIAAEMARIFLGGIRA
jgi:AcrR family transcriptional regulator